MRTCLNMIRKCQVLAPLALPRNHLLSAFSAILSPSSCTLYSGPLSTEAFAVDTRRTALTSESKIHSGRTTVYLART